MKKKIYDYIKKRGICNIHDISRELGIEELKTLEIVNALEDELYVCLKSAVPTDGDNDCSSYYAVTGKLYIDN